MGRSRLTDLWPLAALVVRAPIDSFALDSLSGYGEMPALVESDVTWIVINRHRHA